MAAARTLYLDGAWVAGAGGVRAKHSLRDGRLLAEVGQASPAQVEQALAAAHRAFRTSSRRSPAYQRHDLLAKVSQRIGERAEEFVVLLAEEVGKPRGASVESWWARAGRWSATRARARQRTRSSARR